MRAQALSGGVNGCIWEGHSGNTKKPFHQFLTDRAAFLLLAEFWSYLQWTEKGRAYYAAIIFKDESRPGNFTLSLRYGLFS